MARVGFAAPDFKATALMPDNSHKEISLSDYKSKKYVLLLFYPLDFTFVCPTEILAFSRDYNRFCPLETEILGISVDSVFTHQAWVAADKSMAGLGEVLPFPLVSDLKKEICQAYGVLNPDGIANRASFLIDKQGVIQHALINNGPIGRNVEGAAGIIEALQHFEMYGEVCPANWKKGQKAMKPNKDGVSKYLVDNL